MIILWSIYFLNIREMKLTSFKLILLSLFCLGICFSSCEKDEKKEENKVEILPVNGETPEIGGQKQSLDGSWVISYMDKGYSIKELFNFSFDGNNKCRFSTHNNNYEGVYRFFSAKGKFYIRIDIPELGEKGKDYLTLVSKAYDGNSFEYLSVFMGKKPHQESILFRMDRQKTLQFDPSFFDTEWEVLSDEMKVDKGVIKSMKFSKNGRFIGLLSSGSNIEGTFNTDYTDLLVIKTIYGISDFELKFVSFENKEQTKLKVEFRNPMKEHPIVGFLQKK